MAQNRLCRLYISQVLTPSVAPQFIGDYVLAAAISPFQGQEPSSVTDRACERSVSGEKAAPRSNLFP